MIPAEALVIFIGGLLTGMVVGWMVFDGWRVEQMRCRKEIILLRHDVTIATAEMRRANDAIELAEIENEVLRSEPVPGMMGAHA